MSFGPEAGQYSSGLLGLFLDLIIFLISWFYFKIFGLILVFKSYFQVLLARAGLGPSPGWGPVRVGAHMGPYGPIYTPIWAHVGPYGPIWALMGPPGQVLEDSVDSVNFP